MPEPPPLDAAPPPLVVSLLLAEASARMLAGADGTALVDEAARRHPGAPPMEVHCTPVGPMREVAALVASDASVLSTAQVVVVGLAGDLHDWVQAPGSRSTAAVEAEVEEALGEVVREAKQHGVAVLALNESTYDPAGLPVSYREAGETAALLLHRLDSVLIRQSMEQGISLVDIDRILAADGAAPVMDRLASYTEVAARAIRDELLRVLEDYGFFDGRPPLEQLGRAGRRAARAAQQAAEPQTGAQHG